VFCAQSVYTGIAGINSKIEERRQV